MDRSSRRQIWKLERLVAKTEKLRTAVLTKLEKSRIPYEDTVKRRRPLVRQHATAVAAIAQYGEPKIDEPLVRAWERVLAYYRTKIDGSLPSLDEIPAVEGDYDDDALEAVGKIYRHLIGDPGCGSCWDSGLVHERNQQDLPKYLELHRFGCSSLLKLVGMQRCWNSICRTCQLNSYGVRKGSRTQSDGLGCHWQRWARAIRFQSLTNVSPEGGRGTAVLPGNDR